VTTEERPPLDAKERINQIMEIYNLPENVASYALKKYGWDVERVALLLSDETRYNELRAQAISEEQQRDSTSHHTHAVNTTTTPSSSPLVSVLRFHFCSPLFCVYLYSSHY
jgi:hypothetical protein